MTGPEQGSVEIPQSAWREYEASAIFRKRTQKEMIEEACDVLGIDPAMNDNSNLTNWDVANFLVCVEEEYGDA